MASKLIEIDRARELVLQCTRRMEDEPVALRDALGRVNARDLHSPRAVPPFDSSAMDGFALRSEDVQTARDGTPVSLELVGESRAGHPLASGLRSGQAAVISTGAVVPEGADAVIPLERVQTGDGRLQLREPVSAGNDIRRSGEDIAAGSLVLQAGRVLGPAALGVAASLGHSELWCSRRPRVAAITTGDELLEPGEEQRAGTIYNSNGYAIPGLVTQTGAQAGAHVAVGDDPQATREAIAGALQDAEVIVLCGGVSVGAHDHVRPTLAQLGAQERFWGIALKPGKPTWFGTRGDRLVFGLPGNPVSAMVTFVLLVAPALRAMLGSEPLPNRAKGALASDYDKPAGRAHAVRCRLRAEGQGLWATPNGPQGSHVLSGMLDADALALIPAATEHVSAGEPVELELLDGGSLAA